MNEWINFAWLLFVQFIVFVIVSILNGASLPQILKIAIISALLGLPIGVAHDFLIGKQIFVFSYSQTLESDPVFWITNSVFSYGLTIATAWQFPTSLRSYSTRSLPKIAFIIFFISLCGLVLLPLKPISLAVIVFLAGAMILLATESACIFFGREGALLALSNGLAQPFFVIWSGSVLIGFVYELANSVLGVWKWNDVDIIPYPLYHLSIVILGYFVLVYPMFVVTQLLTQKPNRNNNNLPNAR